MKIVVIDTGINKKLFENENVHRGFGFCVNEEAVVVKVEEAYDDIGHGTAVTSLILKNNKEVEIIPIKVVENGIVAGEECLLAALRYIYKEVECDLINISLGVVCCYNIEALYEICKKLTEKGIVIVAAHDNDGAISYPASFDCVIGIEGVRNQIPMQKFIKVDDSNYIGDLREVRVPWLNGEYKTVSGNSFLCPKVTALIAEKFENYEMDFSRVVDFLENYVYYKYNTETKKGENQTNFHITRAIVFPFNKEMHSLARYEDLLSFEVLGYYDTKYSGQIEKKISDLQNIRDNEKIIHSYEKIDWEADFDTVILGHISEISHAVGFDFEEYIVQKCLKYQKKLFSCRDISDIYQKKIQDIKYYAPVVKSNEYDNKRIVSRKMHVIGRPILGVVGTGSRQGKFSLQLALRRGLLANQFKVGQLGTEPTSLLFGMDEVYPFGYESSVQTKGFDSVYVINHMLGRIERKEPDIILFGSQAHTIPLEPSGANYYPIMQQELLLACQADAYILCVSPEDSMEYIGRNIGYLESLYNSKVIAIVISPFSMNARLSIIGGCRELEDENILKTLQDRLFETYQLPVIRLDDNEIETKLTDVVVNYFQ